MIESRCPKCNVNLNGEDIYQHFFDKYKNEEEALKAAEMYGWSKENPKCFRREIGIEVRGVYDGVIAWKCPDCGHVWPRAGMEDYFNKAQINKNEKSKV